MRLAYRNIKCLYNFHRGLFWSLFLIPFFCTILILYSMDNFLYHSMAQKEDNHNMSIQISFSNRKMSYEIVRNVVKNVYDQIDNHALQCFGMIGYMQYDGKMRLPLESYSMPILFFGRYQEEKLRLYDEYYLIDGLQEGERFNSETFFSARPYGITQNIMDDIVNLENTEIKIIGKRPDTEREALAFPWITVNPAGMQKVPVQSLFFCLKRNLFVEEYRTICETLDKQGLVYEIFYAGMDDADTKAVQKTIAMICGLFICCLGYILGRLYRYILRIRTYDMVIYRLIGCNRRNAVLFIFSEIILTFLPSGSMGFLAYTFIIRRKLGQEYLYLNSPYANRTLIVIFAVEIVFIFAEAVVIAMRHSRCSVREQMIKSNG